MNCWSQLVFFFFSFTFVSLPAQQLITKYSVDEGLPQSTVTSLYRDNDGYLWCGTGAGIGVYDGREFHTVEAIGEKENPALKSIVRGIIPSADQKTVWVGNETSINQFDRKTYKLLKSFDLNKQPGIGEVPVYANDTAVWAIVWTQGLFRVRIADGKTTRLTFDSYQIEVGTANDGQTVLFVDTTRNLIAYDVFTNATRKIVLPKQLRDAEISDYRAIKGSASLVILTSNVGLWQLDLQNETITRFYCGDARFVDTTMQITSLDIHPDGSWWMTVLAQGVYRYDPVAKKLRLCIWQQDGTSALKLLSVPKTIVCDDYGVVWCGTDGDGVVKILHSRITFHDKFTTALVTDTCNWFTRSFYELSQNRFLVGTYPNGLMLVDHNAQTVKHVGTGPLWNATTPLFITESGDGRLLVGTDHSVLLIDTVDWVTTEVDNGIDYDAKYIGYVRMPSGEIIVYGNNGLRVFDLLPGPHLAENVGYDANITAAIVLSDGRLVASEYYDGIQVLTPDLKLVHNYPYDTEIGISTSTSVRKIIEDENGNLWLATEAGVYILGTNFKLKEALTTTEGLADNSIYDMVACTPDKFVFGTGHGITILNPKTRTYYSYYGSDGLPSEECNTGALMFAKSGLLYIGTTTGFVRWNPQSVSTCFRRSSILASLTTQDGSQGGILTESIIRDYGSGSIALDIWLTDFAFPERAKFTRKLDGADETAFTELGLRTINYAALGSGFYSLLISAEIPGCESTGQMKLLTIKIVPPFWMSGWFITVSSLGVILIITLVLFIIMRMNYQRKLRKLKMQQALDKVRARISRDIHDDIGAGLTRIALSGELMAQKSSGDIPQQQKLKVIAGTARELSQSMKEVVWSVNPHYDSLDHMSAYFRSYVAGVAENADLRFKYIAEENIPAQEVNPETRRNLLLILKETVANAVKYSSCTELKLEIRWANEKFTMKISDNGSGFDPEANDKVNSNGLRNIRQRAEASGGTVKFHSESGQGTSVEVTCPVIAKE